MRKHLLSLFAIASMLFASSCSQEEVISQSTGNEVKVTFTTELRNDVKSRAVGDNTNYIDELIFAVYDENEVLLPDLTQSVKNGDIELSTVNSNGTRTATINVVLVKGQTYSFAFWAQDKEYTAYSFNPETKKVSISYGQTANNVNADAFFANFKHTVTGSFEKDITLKRPFAQVNFLNTDKDFELAEKAGFEPDQSSIVVKNAATSLNVLTGDVEGDTEATFTLASLIGDETTTIKDASGNDVVFEGATDFHYLATAYFLPTNKNGAVEIEASMSVIQSENDTKAPVELTVPKVNAQRNYRTNIYGNLLTSNGKFNVTVDPGFDGDHSEVEEDPVTKIVSTFAEAQALFNKGQITNVTIENAPTADVNLTLPNTTNDVTINFAFDANENNNTITIGYNNATTDVPANITIGGGNGSLVIDAGESTVNLEGGVYKTVTATTAENTLIVPASVKIDKLILEKGNAKIYYGNVKEIVNEGNVDITWLVDSKKQLVIIANNVNNGVSFAGHTVTLLSDIDLDNENWTPIGTFTNCFMGNFDGNGHKIMNLKISNIALDSDGYAYAGLFGVTEGTVDNPNYIKNLVIENVNISTPGHIVAAAIAYPYYTNIENVTVQGNINIKGGNYTAGVLAFTRYCVDAKNLTVEGNAGSLIEGKQTVGGVISDIQMNGGLTAKYSNFAASGLTIKGEQSVGGISGIISEQTLDGATVKNVTLVCNDDRTGIVSGADGGNATITNVSYENVTGATRVIGATYKGGHYVGKIVECAGEKAIIFSIEDGVKAVSVEEITLKGKYWQDAMDWAAALGEGWALAAMEDLNAIYDIRVELNKALKEDNAQNALFWEGDELYINNGSIYYANYMSSTEVPYGQADANGNAYFENRVFFKQFNAKGYSDVLYSAFDCINKYAPLRDNYFARAVYTF